MQAQSEENYGFQPPESVSNVSNPLAHGKAGGRAKCQVMIFSLIAFGVFGEAAVGWCRLEKLCTTVEYEEYRVPSKGTAFNINCGCFISFGLQSSKSSMVTISTATKVFVNQGCEFLDYIWEDCKRLYWKECYCRSALKMMPCVKISDVKTHEVVDWKRLLQSPRRKMQGLLLPCVRRGSHL
ncbi:uncharacterized protein V6R79_006545 [Siganus canaliculatus]